jgi:hypothetical protein
MYQNLVKRILLDIDELRDATKTFSKDFGPFAAGLGRESFVSSVRLQKLDH